MILWTDLLIKDPLTLWGGQNGCVVGAFNTLLLTQHLLQPTFASCCKEKARALSLAHTNTQSCSPVHAVPHLTQTQSASLKTHRGMGAYHNTAGSGAGDSVLANVRSFLFCFFYFSSSFACHSLHLGKTTIKILLLLHQIWKFIFLPSRRISRKLSQQWELFLISSFIILLCFYFLYLLWYTQSSSHLETKDDELCWNTFLITLCPLNKKQVCWNYTLLYGSWALQPKATHCILF